jgi:hypothetical protein
MITEEVCSVEERDKVLALRHIEIDVKNLASFELNTDA